MFFYAEDTGVVPLNLLVSSASLSFPNTYVDNISQNTFIVTATGNTTETVTLNDDTEQYTFSPSSFQLSNTSSQIITVTFAPTSWGVKTGSINLVSSGGSTKTVSLSAVCVANPLIITSSVGSVQFQNTYINQTSSATFTVSAGGRVQDIVLLSDNSDQFDFSPSSFSMTGANQTQTVTVYFTPSTAGSKIGILTLSASGGDVAHVSMNGSGINLPLVLTSSIDSLQFNNTYINQTSSQTFTVSSAGQGSETVTLSDDTDQYTFSPSSFVLAGGGASQVVTVTHRPTSLGYSDGYLNIASSGGSYKQIYLSGYSYNAPLKIVPATNNINFGTVPITKTRSYTLNLSIIGTGSEYATIYGHDGSFYFDSSGSIVYSFPITGGQVYPLEIFFTANGIAGLTDTDVLDIVSANNEHNYINVQALLTYEPITLKTNTNSLTFSGNTVLGATSSLTLQVSGTATGATETVTITDNSVDFYATTSSVVIVGDGTTKQNINVKFAPLSSGAKNGLLTLSSSGGDVKTIGLTGSAVSPFVLNTSVNSLSFPTTTVNSSTSANIQIWGSATAGTETVTITDNSALFSSTVSSLNLVGDGGATKQTINLNFSPTNVGTYNALLTLSSSGGSIKTVGLTGSSVEQYYNNTSLLLKGDGTNGSTNIIDSSPNNSTVTVYGNTQISTAQSKYGGSSIYFDGNSDYLSVPSSTNYDFGSGNFTIEMWVNPSTTTNGAQKYLFGKRASNSVYGSILGFLTYSNTTSNTYSIAFYGSFNGTSWGVSYISGYVIPANSWTHLAFVRNGSEYSIFVNGIKTVISNAGGTVTFNSSPFTVGSVSDTSPGTSGFLGYIDDFRVTKGIARYTSNFTPPSSL